MELKLLIYIAIGVIYVISRIIKKSGTQPGDISDEPRHTTEANRPTTSAKPKQLTFEELLKEITESKTAQQQPSTRPTLKPVYADYDDDLEEEEKDLEVVPYDHRRDSKVYEVYEQAKKQAFNKPSLEETVKLQDTEVKFGRFKVFDAEENRNLLEEYTRDFRDPEGFKKAVIMAEILNRRF
jgi:hypothetical protein